MKHLAEYFSNACKGRNFSYSDLTIDPLLRGTAPLTALWDHSNNLRMIYITLRKKTSSLVTHMLRFFLRSQAVKY